ncbi:MAG: crotonobetainyl-CoA--carnitine CoA-transferase [Burkholderiales bacterium]
MIPDPSPTDLITRRVTEIEESLGRRLRASAIPDVELAHNAALYMPPRILKRVLFLNHLYQLALPVHGVIMQFGVRWGRDLAVFDSLRTIYEPFNLSRRVIGFDTFEGFPSVHAKDGTDSIIEEKRFGTAPGYAEELGSLIAERQSLDPLPDQQRCEIRKGEAGEQLRKYLAERPETIVSLAYFDFDIYEPTKDCLEQLKPFVTKGTVMAFDELNLAHSPGETIALKEVYGLDKIRLQRSRDYSGQPSYFIVE